MQRDIEDFCRHLVLERGLSAHTAEAYAVDAGHLLDFAADRGLAVAEIREEDLHQLLCTLRDIGIQPRSQARMIAGIRAFFRFLRMEKKIERDPSELLESPRLGRTLPDVLSVAEIDAMTAAIDPSREESLRKIGRAHV